MFMRLLNTGCDVMIAVSSRGKNRAEVACLVFDGDLQAVCEEDVVLTVEL